MLIIQRNTPYPGGKYSIERNEQESIREYIVERNPPGMILFKMPENLWGGFLPYPPDDCPKSDFVFVADDGTKWLDLSICNYCQEIKDCLHRQNYLKYLAEQRKEALLKSKENKETIDE